MASGKLLLCEGKDDKSVLTELLCHIGISDVEIIDVCGDNSRFRSTIIALPKRNEFVEGQIVSVGIVRDAEAVAGSSFQSIRDALQVAGLPIPSQPGPFVEGTPRVGVFIVSSSSTGTGMIEDICLSSVSNHPDYDCLKEYFCCVHNNGLRKPKNLAKAKVRAWLAMESEFDYGIGIAARKGCFDWNHRCFNELKEFLQSI